MTMPDNLGGEPLLADVLQRRHPLLQFLLICVALIGFVVVAACGALAGLLGGWIASFSDGKLLELAGGAVAGLLAGAAGGPYGVFCAFAFAKRQADPFGWRRAFSDERPYGPLLFAVVVVFFFFFPAAILWVWLIAAIPGAFFGLAAFTFFAAVPPPLLGIGVAFATAAFFGMLIVQEYIRPPVGSRRPLYEPR